MLKDRTKIASLQYVTVLICLLINMCDGMVPQNLVNLFGITIINFHFLQNRLT